MYLSKRSNKKQLQNQETVEMYIHKLQKFKLTETAQNKINKKKDRGINILLHTNDIKKYIKLQKMLLGNAI